MSKKKFPKITTKIDIINVLKNFQPGSGTLHRKAIESGFNDIQKQINMAKKAEESCNQYNKDDPFRPATFKPYDNHWVDQFIRDTLGGKRYGMVVKWKLRKSTWVWDPLTGELKEELEKIDE